MRFFLPESNDLVDPDYDFLHDRYSVEPASARRDVYVHEIFERPPFDGLLVSKSMVPKDLESTIVEAGGIHAYLRLDRSYPILGDCGAFQFIGEEKPPYTNEEIFAYYTQLGFDYGITLDHVIVDFDLAYDEDGSLFPRTPTEAMRHRWQLTLDNAEAMLDLVRRQTPNWVPIGSAQGWSPISYKEAVEALIEMGYDYIAIGGVARASDDAIRAVLETVKPAVERAGVQMHVLGVARASLAADFEAANVTSCDSASTLMQAFKSNTANYHMPDGQHYTCVRIPPVGEGSSLTISPKVSKLLKPLTQELQEAQKALKSDPELGGLQKTYTQCKTALDEKKETLLRLEQQALAAVRAYAKRTVDIEVVMDALIAYEEQFEHNPRMQDLYRKTLAERPWERCTCAICQALGIEVIIMRGNNRNRRRGFHNTHVFYIQFIQRIGHLRTEA